ncbi:MAG: hypothetical protein WC383_11755 [Gammaproteobacteria bacterium]
MDRPTVEPLTLDQARERLRAVAAEFAVPQAAVALLAGFVFGCSPIIRRAFLAGGRRLLRRLI